MFRRMALLFLLGGPSTLLHAQAGPTASRAGDAQIGGAFVLARPDYVQQTFRGFGAYADFDFRNHLGAEVEFHQVDTPSANQVYERTYEVGGRYFRTYGPLVPYAKVLYGRGVFNYPNDLANLAYNLLSLGAGVDVKVGPYLRVRGDYEYQKWSSFPNGGLNPQLFTVGVAYHFAGKPKYK